MSQNQESIQHEDTAIGYIAGVVNAIELLGQLNRFRSWVKTHHHIRDETSLFEGYKFALDSLLRILYDEIDRNRSLGLSEDFIYHRAAFTGVPLRLLPNSCEKTILLKNIYNRTTKLLQAKTWEDLGDGIDYLRQKVLRFFDDVIEQAAICTKHDISSLSEAVRYASMFEVYIFLNDTSRGLPHGYRQSMFGNQIFEGFRIKNKQYLTDVFKGYKYSIQFLWYCLLGERFSKSPLADLHKATNWEQFDEYFERIRSDIILPLEKQLGATLGFDSLLIFEGSAPRILKELIEHKPPEPRLTQKQLLRQLFLWYAVELIDASEVTFNGVAVFVPLLIGIVNLNRKTKAPRKPQVIRLIHPTDQQNRYHYSYAVLIEVGSAIGLVDYSGWTLFYDCCYNYGSGVSGYEFVEKYLRRYKSKIDLAEMEIDRKLFLQLMKGRLLGISPEALYRRLRSKY